MKTTVELLKLEFDAYLRLAEKILKQVEAEKETLSPDEVRFWANKAQRLIDTANIVKGTIEKLTASQNTVIIAANKFVH